MKKYLLKKLTELLPVVELDPLLVPDADVLFDS
jgi:hypothetical protein